LEIDDKAIFGAGSDLQIYHDGSNSWINEVGTGQLILAGEDVRITTPSAGEFMATFGVNGAATLYYDNASKLATTATGIDVTGVITTDGMTTSADINFGDDDKAIFGAGSDLQIYHDGSNSYISDQGANDLKVLATDFQLKNSADNEFMMTAVTDGAVTMYHNNAAKLETTATGIDVTGTVTADGLTVETSSDPASITLRHTGNTSGLIIKNFSGGEAQSSMSTRQVFNPRTP
jgi:predicted regulator of Ras-like GTPase activity (Roadblock/LC7/MglB family)